MASEEDSTEERPDGGGVQAGTFAGCLVLGGVLVALPIGYFWNATVGWFALGILAVLCFVSSITQAQEDDTKAELKQADEAFNAALAEAKAIIERGKQRRRDALFEHWGDEIAQRLVAGEIWQGQTAAMLTDGMGPPDATEEKARK